MTIDPPPDLVIEVEITSSAIQKMKLFAAMGVPEVSHHDGERLQMNVLEDGQYRAVLSSHALPELFASAIDTILEQRFGKDDTALVRKFRESLQ